MNIVHVTKPGHQCHNPLSGTKAAHAKAGEILQLNGWDLWWSAKQNAYIVNRNMLKGDYYQFSNFNCAAAKLAELGKIA